MVILLIWWHYHIKRLWTLRQSFPIECGKVIMTTLVNRYLTAACGTDMPDAQNDSYAQEHRYRFLIIAPPFLSYPFLGHTLPRLSPAWCRAMNNNSNSNNNTQQLLDRDLNECLTVELGWPEVAKGLTKILIGYGIWVAGVFFGAGLVLAPLVQANFKLEHTRLGIGEMWMFYGGMGILSVISIISFGIIMGGKSRKCVSQRSRTAMQRVNFMFLL